MSQPTLNGRLLPPNDWEGDDATPGAHGAYVTCQDTSAGRMLYYATNGEVDMTGQDIRAQIRPRDPDGVSLRQVSTAIASITNPPRILRTDNKPIAEMRNWLLAGLGLVVDGWYASIKRAWREQDNADFGHALWLAYLDPPNYRVWDPLNKNLDGYGKLIPMQELEPFMRSFSGLCGYIPLEPLAPAAEGNPMMNLFPTTVHRVVDVPKNTVLEEIPGGDAYTTLKKAITLGLLSATGTHYYVADGDAGVYLARDTPGLVIRTEDKNVGA
jgi:hypothetical protein